MSMNGHSFDAILFPADGRTPTLVQVMTSPVFYPGTYTLSSRRLPHPEVHMDYISKRDGPNAWKYQIVEALDGMSRKFSNPYIIFYPAISEDRMEFPINRVIREIQGSAFREAVAWRGNIIVGKYSDHNDPFASLTSTTMADYPIVKNYLLHHGSPK
ncbi:hypothetical protein FISHEDRAFT_66747 [Fistulina hepatica ATCC 64428]|uniref:Uncharacterized protein n=1 Tax=Fistulina hepatica ATCC 64428 TaxID=1128425 RepID=A0A0D7A6H9_9AGAR|nr:hypothetical protein FISHEDRAFT_66747 [Fistulina hepatica ATCC 64428]